MRPGRRVEAILVRRVFAIVAILAAGLALWALFHKVSGYAETRLLPYYTLRTLLRLTLTYLAALAFGLVVGILAATRDRIGAVVIPLLDILQSVPVLGFFPVALAVIIRAFNADTVGLELASMFLLFTSMEWSIVFGVIAGVKSIPASLQDMSRVFHIEGWDYIKHVLLPSVYPFVIAGSILAWGSGWYFVVVTEFITFGDKVYSLPGLGYYLNVASFKYENVWMALTGLVIIAGIVFAMNRLIWRRLNEHAREYRFLALHGFSARGPTRKRHFWQRQFRERGPRLVPARGVRLPHWFLVPFYRLLHVRRRNYVMVAAGVLLGVLAAVYGAMKLNIAPVDAESIARATAFSLYRLAVAYAIALVLAVALGFLVLRRPGTKAAVLVVADVMQSIPALAYFPVLWLLFTRFLPERAGLELAAIVLMLTGMMWYLVFNVLEVVEHWPRDLEELSGLMSIRGARYLRDLLLPALLPALVTGSILAWGGGWNASIVAEYVNIGQKVHTIPGLGSSLDIASAAGDTHRLLFILVVMSGIVVAMNHFLWRRLLSRASTHVLEEA